MRRITERNPGEEEITFPLRMLDKDLRKTVEGEEKSFWENELVQK